MPNNGDEAAYAIMQICWAMRPGNLHEGWASGGWRWVWGLGKGGGVVVGIRKGEGVARGGRG